MEELASVVITGIESKNATVDGNISTNSKVLRHEWGSTSIRFEDHLSLKEGTLWDSRIDLLWLCNLERFVLKEVEDSNFPDSEIFKA